MIDVIFLLIIIFLFFLGLFRGFFYIVINFISIYVGIYLSIKFNPYVVKILANYFKADDIILKILSILFIFLFSVSTFSLIHKLLEKLINKSKILTWGNRILGAFTGVLVGIISIYYIVILIQTNKKLEEITLKNSKTYEIIKKIEDKRPLKI
jgi:uncharacterized membrane protein required for colicin V production